MTLSQMMTVMGSILTLTGQIRPQRARKTSEMKKILFFSVVMEQAQTLLDAISTQSLYCGKYKPREARLHSLVWLYDAVWFECSNAKSPMISP